MLVIIRYLITILQLQFDSKRIYMHSNCKRMLCSVYYFVVNILLVSLCQMLAKDSIKPIFVIYLRGVSIVG